MSDSCFAARLGRSMSLSEREVAALAALEASERSLRRGTVIAREHEPASELFVLKQGWVMSYVLLGDGSRQILRLHLPGDFIGMSALVFGIATETLATLTDVVVCPFEASALRVLFDEHSRIAAAMFAMSQLDRVALTDRLVSVGRTSAKARVAALLLDTRERLRMDDPQIGESFNFPLTQEEIGDATGLTAVHVNRMMRALVEEGLITRSGSRITILDCERLTQATNYIDRSGPIDTRWLPISR